MNDWPCMLMVVPIEHCDVRPLALTAQPRTEDMVCAALGGRREERRQRKTRRIHVRGAVSSSIVLVVGEFDERHDPFREQRLE